MVRGGGTLAGMPGSDIAATALETHGELAVSHALTLLRQKLGEEHWLLATEPHRALARALGEGLAAAANRKHLIFIQDTYEIVDSADPVLREAIFTSGPRVLWVIAGRRDLARNNAARRFPGYNAVSDRVRLRALPELGEFSLNDIKIYFGEAVPRTSLPGGGAEVIYSATQGIPLAVRLAAEVWRRTGDLRSLSVGGGGDRDKLVEEMAGRFLVHCTDEDERSQLYALALLRRPNPHLFRAMSGDENSDAESILQRLGERYDFIFAADDWLHDKVRYFLRERLKSGLLRKGKRVEGLNERALVIASREQMLQEQQLTTWEERVDSQRWGEWALDALYHHLWLDPSDAWHVWPAYFLAGLAYDRAFGRAVLEMVRELDSGDSRRGRDALAALDSLTQMPWGAKRDVEAMGHLRRLVTKLAEARRGDAELKAVLGWAEVRLLLDQDDANAQLAGDALLALLPTLEQSWEVLRGLVGDALNDAARMLLFPENRHVARITSHAAPLLDAARDCKEWNEDAAFWNIYGIALRMAGRHPEALVSYREALRIDPSYALAHNNLGNALRSKGDLNRAEAAAREALRLDPNIAVAHNSLGNTLRAREDLEGAIAAYHEALRLDAAYADAYSNLGTTLRAMNRWEEAEIAHRQALELDDARYVDWIARAEIARRKRDQSGLQEAIARARPLAVHSDPYNAACFESIAGNTEEALRLLREAIQQAPVWVSWARRDPDLHWIRDDPRFEEVLRETGA